MYTILENCVLIVGPMVVVAFLLELFFYWQRRPFLQALKSVPMSERTFPIIGHVRLLGGDPKNFMMIMNKFYEELREDNMKVWVLNRVVIFISKVEDIALTLGGTNFTNKSKEYRVMQESIMGQSLFATTNLTEWKRNRKIINPAFHFQVLKTFISSFYDEANVLADKLIGIMEKDGEVEVSHPTGLCTMAMIMKNAMGVSDDVQSNSNHIFVRGLKTILNVWKDRILKPWNLNKYIFYFSSLKARHDAAMRDIQSFATEIILIKLEERLEKSINTGKDAPNTTSSGDNEDDETCGLRKPKVFLDLLIEYAFDGVDEKSLRRIIKYLRTTANPCPDKTDACNEKSFTNNGDNKNYICVKTLEKTFIKCGFNFAASLLDRLCFKDENSIEKRMDIKDDEGGLKLSELQRLTRQIRDEVITIMVGGQETTATENSFAVVMLAIHQEAQRKVLAELNEIFGDDCRSPNYDDLQKMEYLECVIKETMRLYPSLPIMLRVAEQDTALTDKNVILKGCTVCYFSYGLHRDPRYYPDPHRFIPERFLTENSRNRNPYCFMPFAAGVRNCIGQKYAMFQMKVILSTLVRNFKIFPSERMPTLDHIQLDMSSTLHSKTGCWVKLERRNVRNGS